MEELQSIDDLSVDGTYKGYGKGVEQYVRERLDSLRSADGEQS